MSINFIPVDAEQITNDLIKQFEDVLGITLYPGDERRIFLLQMVPIIVGLKNNINDSANQNLLKYASGSVLDELGEFYDTARLQAQKSTVTVRFTLSAAQTFDVTVPQGTRVTPDGKLYFVTTKSLTITTGQTVGDVSAEAAGAGKIYNDYTVGQIKSIVDPVAYVASVASTDISSGGSDIETDDAYRERIRLAPEAFSVAGSEGAYIYWAKTADVNITDIAVLSPSAGTVKIVVLLQNGEIPGQTILDLVNATCSAKNRRPLTDNVTVVAPTAVNYNITLTYYISNERLTDETSIKSAIEDSGGCVDQYKLWQMSKLGRDINPDYLRQLLLNAGAFRVDVTSPTFTAVDADKIATVGTVTITYGGLI